MERSDTMEREKQKLAIQIAEHTLLCVMSCSFPLPFGNCFSVLCSDGSQYRIVNFVLENLYEAVRRGVSWPIKVKPISEHCAVIHDERIPHSWYQDHWCEVCCPERLLPVQQRLAHDRDEACGARVVSVCGVTINFSKRPRFE